MDPGLLYVSPFIDLNPRGVEGLFTSGQVAAIVSILNQVRQSAAVA